MHAEVRDGDLGNVLAIAAMVALAIHGVRRPHASGVRASFVRFRSTARLRLRGVRATRGARSEVSRCMPGCACAAGL